MDPYATHQRALVAAALMTEGPMVEMGCGDYSTPILHEIAKHQGRKFTVYCTDREQASKFTGYVDVVILNSWKDYHYPQNVGFTFLDNEEYVRDRKLHIPKLLETSDVVICHDMSDNEWGASWSETTHDNPPTLMISNKIEGSRHRAANDTVPSTMPVFAIETVEPNHVQDPPGYVIPTVACVYKTGGDFTAEYVTRLFYGVMTNSSRKIRFVVYTDSDEDMPGDKVSLTENLPGWWSKLELFRKFEGRTVFFDLDTIITGSLEPLYDYDGPMAIIRDFYNPSILSTGVMAWNSPMQFLYPSEDEKRIIMENPRAMDQHYIVRKLTERKWNIDIVQDIIPLVSYKAHCRDGGVPKEARIVCFHGKPRPHEVGWSIT